MASEMVVETPVDTNIRACDSDLQKLIEEAEAEEEALRKRKEEILARLEEKKEE